MQHIFEHNLTYNSAIYSQTVHRSRGRPSARDLWISRSATVVE